jgi:branched-chain amino acid transport system substrate-binding protein
MNPGSPLMPDDIPAGVLEGVKGTIPGALSDRQMKSALHAVNPNVTDFSYGPWPMTPSS